MKEQLRPQRDGATTSCGIGGRLASLVATLAAALLLLAATGANAATIPVTNTDGSGQGSLRQAIVDANGTSEADVIDATGVTGRIGLSSALGDLTDDVEIRGPGADQLTVARNLLCVIIPPQPCPDFRIFTVGSGVTAEISGLTISGGRALGSSPDNVGGGILNAGGTLTVRNSTVSGNEAEASGGIQSDGTLVVVNSTVSGNTAPVFNAGGIGSQTSSGALTVVNSTVSGNATAGRGGGIWSTGPTTLTNSTVSLNEAPIGANLRVDTDGATLKSTIIAHPQPGNSENCRVESDPITSAGYNLASDASCELTEPTDRPNTIPALSPLSNNGGPTETMALLEGSPAIDAGISDGLTTDQRGLPRPSDFLDLANAPGGDGSDIGAFELQAPAPSTPSTPSNEFSFGKLKKNKKRGTAKLTVIVPGSGSLGLAKTKKIKSHDKRAAAAGEARLAIKPKPKLKQKLKAKGKAKVKAAVTYTPDGGAPNTQSRRLKLVRR